MHLLCGQWLRGGGVTAEGLAGMLAALPVHGSSTDKQWTQGPVALACRHSGMAEEQTGALPYFDSAAGLAIAVSAHLCGRGSLCEALGIPRELRTHMSDSELILRAYRHWGLECPAHLLGDFTFVVWDANEERLFCVRDHIGSRPFYYCSGTEGLVFASRIDAVLAAPGVSGELDESAIAAWLRPPAVAGARTFFRAVRRLMPGHALVAERAEVRIERWWRPEETPPAPLASDDEYAEAFLELYTEAVRDCLHTIHPVGVHLSGGLDSSSVAVLAARELRRQGRPAPRAFAWHPSPPRLRPHTEAEAFEYGLIEAVCEQEGLETFYCPPDGENILAFLRHDVTRGALDDTLIQEEPVQRCAAQQGVRVLLSGWGGDEGISFNGRGYLQQLLLSAHFGRLWREVRERGGNPLIQLLNVALPLVAPARFTQTVKRLGNGRWWHRRSFIHPAFARRVQPPGNDIRPVSVRSTQLSLLRLGHLSQRTESWTESAAQYGIEYRYPLLDRRVLDFALSLPPEQYRCGPSSRLVMRRALRPVLPPQVRRNTEKRDPVRTEGCRNAMFEALLAARQLLEAQDTSPSRSSYVDLPRMVALLDRLSVHPEAVTKNGPMISALRFLDFGG